MSTKKKFFRVRTELGGGKPYKITMEKIRNFQFPILIVDNRIITDNTEKYEHIFKNLFQSIPEDSWENNRIYY